MCLQGLMDYPDEIVDYLIKKGVMVIFLFRRNALRRLVSVLANDNDKKAKQLNGTHKAHVHSQEEVTLACNLRSIHLFLLPRVKKESKALVDYVVCRLRS